MFGFSLTKLLFTVAAVLIVWYGFRWVGRVQARKRVEAERRMRTDARPGTRPGAASTQRRSSVEDMTVCPACGDYVAANGARNCGRADCPYPG